jgi:hypothetical protein
MSRVDKIGQILMDVQPKVEIGTSSSSSYPKEQIVEEGLHKLTNVQQLPQLVCNFDNFIDKLHKYIISSNIHANFSYVGIWGISGGGKTLLGQMSYKSQ